MKIGPIQLATPVVLAPMAGVTNAPFRKLCRSFGGGLYVNEMISARALVEGNSKTNKLASFDSDESPRSIQLAGVEPRYIKAAVELLVTQGMADHIDLNFGCPVRKVTRNGGGGALPFKRHLFGAIVSAAVDAAGATPVTVKMRVGIDDDHITYLDAGRIAADLGVAAVALHGRTVAQLYSGQADWSTIGRLREALPAEIPVLGNGDIWEAGDALAMMAQTGCDGVVIGRGCLGRPWLFGELEAALAGEPIPAAKTTSEVVPIMLDHATALIAWFDNSLAETTKNNKTGLDSNRGIKEFRKHTAWYLKGYPLGGELRRRLSMILSLDELSDILGRIPDVALPVENRRVARGHTRGPQTVTLPEGWLEDPFDHLNAHPDGDSAVSGG